MGGAGAQSANDTVRAAAGRNDAINARRTRAVNESVVGVGGDTVTIGLLSGASAAGLTVNGGCESGVGEVRGESRSERSASVRRVGVEWWDRAGGAYDVARAR